MLLHGFTALMSQSAMFWLLATAIYPNWWHHSVTYLAACTNHSIPAPVVHNFCNSLCCLFINDHKHLVFCHVTIWNGADAPCPKCYFECQSLCWYRHILSVLVCEVFLSLQHEMHLWTFKIQNSNVWWSYNECFKYWWYHDNAYMIWFNFLHISVIVLYAVMFAKLVSMVSW